MTAAVLYTLGSVTVPSLASVYNEMALKKHMDTSIDLQARPHAAPVPMPLRSAVAFCAPASIARARLTLCMPGRRRTAFVRSAGSGLSWQEAVASRCPCAAEAVA